MMMAKPKHGRLNIHHPAPISVPRPHHAPRFPSPAVLSALAVIAAVPPVVAGAPLSPPTQPPDFLCPFIQLDNTHVTPHPRENAPSTSAATPIVPSKCDVVAGKFVQGTDSLWRKTDAWTLYGSTCFPSSVATPSAGPSRSNSSQTPVPTSTPSANNFDTSVLPAGWNNITTPKSNTESTIIFALAICLAGSICVLVIGCVIWRRRKKRERDIERKLGHKPDVHDDSQAHVREKDPRNKLRVWAKATARWKTHVRQSARRRRRRHVSPSLDRPLSPTFSDSLQIAVVVPSVQAPEEPEPSRREVVLRVREDATGPPAVHDSPRSASPPTYGASYPPSISCPPPNSAVPNPTSAPLHIGPDSIQRSDKPSFIDDEPLPYTPPSDGHVATDDKSKLAHIQDLASSPPTISNAASANTMQSVSAPEWHEVEDNLEDLDLYLSEVPASFHNGLPPFFPPPPSRADARLPFGYLDDPPLRYGEEDDILVSLPVPGSSGHTVGAFPSAPPFDDPGLEPSAPPLEGEEGWERASSYNEVFASADPDCTPASAASSSVSSSVSPASHSSFPPIPESAVRDGIPPRYHP